MTITDLTVDGWGVGRTESGLVVTLPGTYPGDRINLISWGKKPADCSFELLDPSRDRCTHPCPHYREGCAGSILGNYRYEAGLEWKRNHLKETLRRIGGVEIEVPPLIASPISWRYRDRLNVSLSISNHSLLIGYKSKIGLVAIKDCELAIEPVRSALKLFIEYARESKWGVGPVIDPERQIPVGRLLVRFNGIEGVVAILLLDSRQKKFSKMLAGLLGRIGAAGWQLRMSENVSSFLENSTLLAMSGQSQVQIRSGDQVAFTSNHVFSQVNSEIAGKLTGDVVELCRGNEKVLDLFGGWGMFGQQVAAGGARVIVVDSDRDALAAGQLLAQKRRLDVDYQHGDLYRSEAWSKLPSDSEAVIVDPPFNGLRVDGIEWLNNVGPERVIYISCHPATMARDIKSLNKYRLSSVQAYDMFPQTTSLETLALLERTA